MISGKIINGNDATSFLKMIKKTGWFMEIVEDDDSKYVYHYLKDTQTWKVELFIGGEYMLDFKKNIINSFKRLEKITSIRLFQDYDYASSGGSSPPNTDSGLIGDDDDSC